MTKQMRVLVFPAGSEIAAEVRNALSYQKDVRLYGATSVIDHSEMLFKNLVTDIPFLGEEGLIDRLNEVIREWNIDFLWPARDDVQLYFTQHETELECRVVTSPLSTVETLRSKRATYETLTGEDFVPRTYDNPTEADFPLFAKPAVGEGSKGARLVTCLDEAQTLLGKERDYLLCEYLPGTEYTVDCFTGTDGQLLCCVPRTRGRVLAGISVRSERVFDGSILAVAQRIAETLNARFEFRGAWFFQLKERADGTPVLMEVSPRVPGTMGLSRVLGANYPLLTLYMLAGKPFEARQMEMRALLDKGLEGTWRLDIDYDTVYVDYDDTLTLGRNVNAQAMAFLYQCRNEGKRLVLLTRHDDAALGELHEDMRIRGIAESLFDEIIHMASNEQKSNYITESNSIFIDDSFRERMEIETKCRIPTFDPSSVEALIDRRV